MSFPFIPHTSPNPFSCTGKLRRMEMKMEGDEASSWWKLMMIETAKQELELLESKYPNQFEFFKMELKSIIPLHTDLPTSSVATQASTNVMKKKREEVALHNRRRRRHRKIRRFSTPTNTSKDLVVERKRERMKEDERVEVALERAKACLEKIHDLKIQLLIC